MKAYNLILFKVERNLISKILIIYKKKSKYEHMNMISMVHLRDCYWQLLLASRTHNIIFPNIKQKTNTTSKKILKQQEALLTILSKSLAFHVRRFKQRSVSIYIYRYMNKLFKISIYRRLTGDSSPSLSPPTPPPTPPPPSPPLLLLLMVLKLLTIECF